MTSARRYLVLVALMFWQGGFVFYAAIVVPAGTEVLKSDRRQGFITRKVTRSLNVTGAVALAVLATEVFVRADRSRFRRWARASLWSLMVACQAALFVLHPALDAYLLEKGGIVTDPEAFRPYHRAYLWAHTVQWAAGLWFIGLILRGWRCDDEMRGAQKKCPASDPSGVAQSPE